VARQDRTQSQTAPLAGGRMASSCPARRANRFCLPFCISSTQAITDGVPISVRDPEQSGNGITSTERRLYAHVDTLMFADDMLLYRRLDLSGRCGLTHEFMSIGPRFRDELGRICPWSDAIRSRSCEARKTCGGWTCRSRWNTRDPRRLSGSSIRATSGVIYLAQAWLSTEGKMVAVS